MTVTGLTDSKLDANLMQAKVLMVDAYLDRYFSEASIHARTQKLASPSNSQPSRLSGHSSPATLNGNSDRFHEGCQDILKSTRYSLLQTGKRFRPSLALMTAEALGVTAEHVLAYAAAVECIHTYSLIHDDLPCMDNDDMRRGQPTNHKVFAESTALLAGDALLTEAFRMIASAYRSQPALAIEVTLLLSEAAGIAGMVGGQAMDMHAKRISMTLSELESMHRLKTGALIRAACVGAAILSRASADQLAQAATFAENLGLAFQVADDILDYDPLKPETGSFPSLLGLEKSKTYLQELSENCLTAVSGWSATAEPMRKLVLFNLHRTH